MGVQTSETIHTETIDNSESKCVEHAVQQQRHPGRDLSVTTENKTEDKNTSPIFINVFMVKSLPSQIVLSSPMQRKESRRDSTVSVKTHQ